MTFHFRAGLMDDKSQLLQALIGGYEGGLAWRTLPAQDVCVYPAPIGQDLNRHGRRVFGWTRICDCVRQGSRDYMGVPDPQCG